MLSPSMSIHRRCLVHKLISLALTTFVTLTTFACLVLAGSADGIGPG